MNNVPIQRTMTPNPKRTMVVSLSLISWITLQKIGNGRMEGGDANLRGHGTRVEIQGYMGHKSRVNLHSCTP